MGPASRARTLGGDLDDNQLQSRVNRVQPIQEMLERCGERLFTCLGRGERGQAKHRQPPCDAAAATVGIPRQLWGSAGVEGEGASTTLYDLVTELPPLGRELAQLHAKRPVGTCLQPSFGCQLQLIRRRARHTASEGRARHSASHPCARAAGGWRLWKGELGHCFQHRRLVLR